MANEQNLTPVQPGQVLNPNGRPKGSKNLSTIIRELEAEDFDWSLVPIKQKDAARQIGSPWRAIVFTAVAKAYSGDVAAMKWLKDSGYGSQVDITSGGAPLNVMIESVYANKPNFRPDNSPTEADDVAADSSPESS